MRTAAGDAEARADPPVRTDPAPDSWSHALCPSAAWIRCRFRCMLGLGQGLGLTRPRPGRIGPANADRADRCCSVVGTSATCSTGLLAAARGRQSVVWCCGGEPGVGKSALRFLLAVRQGQRDGRGEARRSNQASNREDA